MKPILFLSVFDHQIGFPAMDALILLSFSISLALLWAGLKATGGSWKIPLFASVIAIASIVGGRLFHVFFERWEYFQEHPERIMTRFDGMTFYGGFILATFIGWLMARLLFSTKERARLGDLAAIAGAASYAILRVGCFLQGCCWGKATSVPWSVRYFHPHSSMPFLGIPVHPTQLYDSFHGLLMTILLIGLYRSQTRLQGRLFAVFCLLYATGRFITEFFRGDDFRGTNVLWGQSISQVLSIAVLLVSLLWLMKNLKKSPSWRPECQPCRS